MTFQPITADLCARAIIAASACYGLAAEKACASLKDPMMAAAYGLSEGARIPTTRACGILGVSASGLAAAKSRGGMKFWTAAQAAEEEVRKHYPAEARKSLDRLAALSAAIRKSRENSSPRPISRRTSVVFRKAEKPAGDRCLRDKIIDVLADAPCTAASLAILTDAKEIAVADSLRVLEHEGRVRAGPPPEQGARHRQWALSA